MGTSDFENQQARQAQAFRLLMENLSDYAIFFLDTDGRVSYWNAGAQHILGYEEAEVIGKSGSIIFTPEDRQKGAPEAEMQRAIAEGRAEDERWHVRKDGTQFWGSGIMTALRDESGALQGFAKVLRDFTERKETEAALRRAHEELEQRVVERTHELWEEVAERRVAEERVRNLLRRLVFAQEDERTRISRDLHDHLGQQATAMKLKLELLMRQWSGSEISGQVEELAEMMKQLDADLSFLAWELRPAGLEQVGLKAALATFVEEWSNNFKINAEFQSSGVDGTHPAPEVETSLYRIAQEALNNAAKYSRAASVSVLYMHRDNEVALVIEDDGVGFDPKEVFAGRGKKRLGLIGMQERAALVGGRVEIEAKPGIGTTVIARVPLSMNKQSKY